MDLKYGDVVRTSGGDGMVVARVVGGGLLVAHSVEVMRDGRKKMICRNRTYRRFCDAHQVWCDECAECKKRGLQ